MIVPRKLDISLLCTGPVSSVLVNRYGSRPVVMVGGVMVSAGMVLASFGRTIMHLYLCVGVIGGTFLYFSLSIIIDKIEFIWILRTFTSKVAGVSCNVCFML